MSSPEPYRQGFQHGDPLGYPAFCCPFCHLRGTWRMLRHGDAVVSWACDTHVPLVLDSLQRREPGSTEISVWRVVEQPSTKGSRECPECLHPFHDGKPCEVNSCWCSRRGAKDLGKP